MSPQKPRSHSEDYMAHVEAHGSCPIEAGLIGRLADNECPHDHLPTDRVITCGCFTERP